MVEALHVIDALAIARRDAAADQRLAAEETLARSLRRLRRRDRQR